MELKRNVKPSGSTFSSNNPNQIVGGNMAQDTLQTLYINELKDIYSAEQQLVKALPKMVKSAESQELSEAFENHLEETKNQVSRLEQIFESLGENPKGIKCVGMEGIVKEGAETMDEYDGKLLDAGLISAAQRVEHYEMAAYGSVCAYAELLDRSEDLGLLKETLEEEKQADEKLTELSETINQEALGSSDEEAPEAKTAGRENTRPRKNRSAA
jgi:ferritin-like metal-binding protein YciE